MATASMRAGSSAHSALPQTKIYHESDLAALPNVYAATGRGGCLEPVFYDGACLVFDTQAKPRPGDFIGLRLRPEATKPGQPQQMVKRLIAGPPSEGMPMPSGCAAAVIVETLNPPRRMTFAASDVMAIHKCLGEGKSEGEGLASVRKSLLSPAGGA